MQISSTVILGFFAAVLSTVGVHSKSITERQSGSGGIIVAPAPYSVITASELYNFTYQIPTYCSQADTWYTVYLLQSELTPANVTTTGELREYLWEYGTYAIPDSRKSSTPSPKKILLNGMISSSREWWDLPSRPV